MWGVVGSGILGTLIGLYLGNRLALGRDKRKEFNDATLSLREKLPAHIEQLKRGSIEGPVDDRDIRQVVAKIGEDRAAKVKAKFNRYSATLQKAPDPNKWGAKRTLSPGHTHELLGDAENLYRAVQPKG